MPIIIILLAWIHRSTQCDMNIKSVCVLSGGDVMWMWNISVNMLSVLLWQHGSENVELLLICFLISASLPVKFDCILSADQFLMWVFNILPFCLFLRGWSFSCGSHPSAMRPVWAAGAVLPFCEGANEKWPSSGTILINFDSCALSPVDK